MISAEETHFAADDKEKEIFVMKKRKVAKVLVKVPLAVAVYAVYDLAYSAYISCSAFEFDWQNIVIPVAGVAVIEFSREIYRAYVRKHASF